MESAIDLALSQGAVDLTLRGGELLLRPEALDLLQHARKRGARAIHVWTSGTLLARPGTAQALRQAGATHVTVGLLGDSAVSHDYVTGVDGHFQRVIMGLKSARAAGLHTWVVAPLLRPTFRNVATLAQKTLPIGVTGVRLWAPDGPDREEHPLLAPLQLMAPAVRAAVTLLGAAKRQVAVDGVPACLLGDAAAAMAGQARYIDAQHLATFTQESSSDETRFGPPCADCTARATCRGVASERSNLHGWVGFTART